MMDNGQLDLFEVNRVYLSDYQNKEAYKEKLRRMDLTAFTSRAIISDIVSLLQNSSFRWVASFEGHEYWRDVSARLTLISENIAEPEFTDTRHFPKILLPGRDF